MKICISYFYQIRNFKPYMIPVSTAVGDPRWYYKGSKQGTLYVDKNGVLNGLRCPELAPGKECHGLCRGDCKDKKTIHLCAFLQAYQKQLADLDIKELIQRCEKAATAAQNLLGFQEEPIIVFMVHEAPQNPCSERDSLKYYFLSHGIECEELSYPIA